MDPIVDRAHVPAPLAVDQGESSWLCAELSGTGREGPRRFAVLAWIHRTGPRLGQFDTGPGVLDHDQLPAKLRDRVPSWLPIITPVKVRTDDRPLLMLVLYDLDRPDAPPVQIEQEVSHADFDADTFSASTRELALRVDAERIVIEARSARFRLHLEARAMKPAVSFGEGSPMLRHGDIEVGYLQRSRLSVSGAIALDGDVVDDAMGEGAHDRHWRTSTQSNLAWLWLHVRLDRDREINAYVIRDSRGPGRELGRGCWWIDPDACVRPLGEFVLERRGERYLFEAAALDVRIELVHAIEHPYLRMKAFGDAIDGGISEAPIRVVASSSSSPVRGWLEVFDAATCVAR